MKLEALKTLDNAKSDTELISMLDTEKTRRINAMSKYYREWIVAEQFYNGEHWIKYDSDGGLRNLQRELAKNRDLQKVNRIEEYVDIMTAQLGSGRPDIGFIPATQSIEDVSSTKVCGYTLEYIDRINDAHIQDHTLHRHKLLYGTGIDSIDWGMLRGEENVVQEVVHPREILPRLNSKGDFNKVIRYRTVEAQLLYDHYGEAADKLSPTSTNTANTAVARNVQNMGIEKFDNPITLCEYYEETSERYPQGRYIVWASNIMLEDNTSIYKDGRTPFIRHIFKENPVESFWGVSYVQGLIPLQVTLNKTLTIIHEYIRRAVKTIIPVASGSDIDEAALRSSDMFIILPYNRNSMPPSSIPMSQLSIDPWKQLEVIESQMMDKAHIHLVTKGMAERNVRSDVAQRTLREQDEHPLTITVQNFEQGKVTAAQMKLELAQKFYPEEKLISVVGRNGKVHIAPFKKAKIAEEIDVVCEPNSAMPHSRALQQATILELLKMGVFNPQDPRTMRIIRETLKYNSLEALVQDEDRAQAQAIEEHEAILRGEEIQVMPYENHKMHLSKHREQSLADSFHDWGEIEQAALYAHMDWHDSEVDKQIEKTAQRMAIMQGQPQEQVEEQITQIAQENA